MWDTWNFRDGTLTFRQRENNKSVEIWRRSWGKDPIPIQGWQILINLSDLVYMQYINGGGDVVSTILAHRVS